MFNRYDKIKHIGTLAVCAFLMFLVSCKEDGPDRLSLPVKNTFVISTEDSDQPIDPGLLKPEADSGNELINTWWMVFARKTDKSIYAVVTRPDQHTDPVEKESVEADLPVDTYLVYAFANITPEELEEKTGLSFEVGSGLPENLESAMWKVMENNPDKDKPIPMSGSREGTVTGRVNEPFAIEVVRMLAKVEFCFMNESESDINVLSVNFTPLNAGAVPLLPNFNPAKPPVIAEGCGVETITCAFGKSGLHVPDGTSTPVRDKFYVRESVAESHPTKHFNFSLKVKRDGKEEEQLYALTDELSYINRNDYIQIPVLFAELKFELSVRFYPPIGGYPAVEIESKPEEHYITFGSSGGFEIEPRFTNIITGTELSKDKIKVKVIGISDPAHIFEREPVAEVSGEVTGVLSSEVTKGTAEVSLTIEVSLEGGVKRVYKRKVYIIRK